MPTPGNTGDLAGLRKLLDRLATVHPRCMPDVIIDKWLTGDADARRKIEASIDHMPKKPN